MSNSDTRSPSAQDPTHAKPKSPPLQKTSRLRYAPVAIGAAALVVLAGCTEEVNSIIHDWSPARTPAPALRCVKKSVEVSAYLLLSIIALCCKLTRLLVQHVDDATVVCLRSALNLLRKLASTQLSIDGTTRATTTIGSALQAYRDLRTSAESCGAATLNLRDFVVHVWTDELPAHFSSSVRYYSAWGLVFIGLPLVVSHCCYRAFHR